MSEQNPYRLPQGEELQTGLRKPTEPPAEPTPWWTILLGGGLAASIPILLANFGIRIEPFVPMSLGFGAVGLIASTLLVLKSYVRDALLADAFMIVAIILVVVTIVVGLTLFMPR